MLGVLRAMPGLSVEVIPLGSEDFRRYPAPKLLRVSNTLESAVVVSRKFRHTPIPPHDAAIFVSLDLAAHALPYMPATPCAVVTDATPASMRRLQMAKATSLKRRALLQASGYWQERWLRKTIHRMDRFLLYSTWCRDSLVNDYGVPAERCKVIMTPKAPLPLRPSTPPGSPFRLLFVGNDFLRKGGDLMMDAFSRRLAACCSLTIVSNDPYLRGLSLPAGVRWISGLTTAEAVAPLYAGHDLLLYPSRLDMFSHVIAEAAMAGVPSFTSDVGGVRDLVQHRVTGEVLPLSAGADAWAAAVLDLVNDPVRHAAYARAALAFARDALSMEKFESVMRETVGALLPQFPVGA